MDPVSVAISLLNNSNVVDMSGTLSPQSIDLARKLIRHRLDINLLLIDKIDAILPLCFAGKAKLQLEKILQSYCDNILLAKRNRQKIPPLGAVMICLSIKERLLRIHTAGYKDLLSLNQAKKIIAGMSGDLEKENYSKAVVTGLRQTKYYVFINKVWDKTIAFCRRWTPVVFTAGSIVAFYRLIRRSAFLRLSQNVSNAQSGVSFNQLICNGNDVDNEHEECGICLSRLSCTSPFQKPPRFTGYEVPWETTDLINAATKTPQSLLLMTLFCVSNLKGSCRTWSASCLAMFLCLCDYVKASVGARKNAALPQTQSLVCGHSFHAHCIERWASFNASCPFCRCQISANKTTALGTVEQETPTETPLFSAGDRVYFQPDVDVQALAAQEREVRWYPATVIGGPYQHGRPNDGFAHYDLLYQVGARSFRQHNISGNLLVNGGLFGTLFLRYLDSHGLSEQGRLVWQQLLDRYHDRSAFRSFWHSISQAADFESIRGHEPSETWYAIDDSTSCRYRKLEVPVHSAGSHTFKSWGDGGGGTSASW